MAIEYRTNQADVKVYNDRGTERGKISTKDTLVTVSGAQLDIGAGGSARGSCYPISAPIAGFVQVGKVYETIVPDVPPPPPAPPPPPIIIPSGFYLLLGDEFLADFNFQSRTLNEYWAYNEETPCIFRYNPTPSTPTEYRTDVTWLEKDIDRINGWTEASNRRAYYRSGGTAFFNAPRPDTKYPRKLNATMANNVFEPIAIEGRYLKFKTVKAGENVSHMTPQTHPQFVHKWDIVKGVKLLNGQWITQHKDTPHGRMYYFLVSNIGHGYIPLKWVKKV